MSPAEAADTALNYMKTRVGGLGGVIVVSNSGDWAARFSTKQMSWATVKDDQLQYGIYTGEIHTSSVCNSGDEEKWTVQQDKDLSLHGAQ